MDEGRQFAKAFDIEEQYNEMSATGNISYEQKIKWLSMLSRKPHEWVLEKLEEAEVYEGSLEAIKILKRKGCENVIITDDFLMSVHEYNEIIKRKLDGVDKIIPTAEIAFDGGKMSGLKNIKSKPLIMQELLKQYGNTPEILCMIQGINDIGMAEYAKKHGGTVISVNSHSQELESVSHHHIETIAEAPELLEKILLKDRLT